MSRAKSVRMFVTVSAVCLCMMAGLAAYAQHDTDKNNNNCKDLPSWGQLKAALNAAVMAETSGFNLHMWATIVDRDGIVCAIAFSGTDRGAQWPGSRVISAQKANTANSFSLDKTSSSAHSGAPSGLALSTANLYSAVQPGGSLFGLQFSNPVDTGNAYDGPSQNYGQANDPLVGDKVGGVNVFGGGLALYATTSQKIIGGLGLSGDTSCSDHFIAWHVRHGLKLDHMAGLPGPASVFATPKDADHPDNIIFDLGSATPSGFGHPDCFNDKNTVPLEPVIP